METYNTRYTLDDYRRQEELVNEMPPQELAQYARFIARGWLPDYNFTGKPDDFCQHKEQMIMARIARLLEKMEPNQ